MKRPILYILTCVSFLLVACQSKKEENKQEFLRPSEIVTNEKDTTEITQQTLQFIECLRCNDLRSAADMLYKVDSDSIMVLPEEEKQNWITGISHFKIYDAAYYNLIIRSDRNNEVGIKLQIIESGDIREDRGITKFFLNPVLYKGAWYLTVLDTNAEGVKKLYE